MSEASAEILKPFGEYRVPGKVEAVIKVLRGVLEAAERGEVVALALATIDPNGFQRSQAVPGSRGHAELIGASVALQADILDAWRPK